MAEGMGFQQHAEKGLPIHVLCKERNMESSLRRVRLRRTPQFQKDCERLSEAQQQKLWDILEKKFVYYLERGLQPANSLRTRGFQNEPGTFEMTPLVDLRIKWTHGESVERNEILVNLLQIGGHRIYKKRARR